MNNKPKPDDRRDNVEKIQYNINHTISNYRETEEMIDKVDDPEERRRLEEKNKRREESLEGMRREIRDEAIAKEKDINKSSFEDSKKKGLILNLFKKLGLLLFVFKNYYTCSILLMLNLPIKIYAPLYLTTHIIMEY